MRGSLVGLSLDSSLADLALKFNVTLEAIALQTRHIVDTLNANGHSIQEIYVSGGQAKNAPLVQLLADVCGIPVILPGLDGGSSVVLGAAMLGRFATEVTTQLSNPASGASKSIGSEDQGLHAGQTRQERAPVLRTQLDVDRESKGFGSRLWNIMVRIAYRLHSHPLYVPTHRTPTALCPHHLGPASLRAVPAP
jgi:glycerol kinase